MMFQAHPTNPIGLRGHLDCHLGLSVRRKIPSLMKYIIFVWGTSDMFELVCIHHLDEKN